MPRDIPVGNGRLLVCFDGSYAIRDLYYPHVGEENHLGGGRCLLGVWVDGRFSWVGDGWRKELGYLEDTLVTEVHLYHPGLRVLITSRDAADFHENIFLREMEVENLASTRREVRVFFSQDFNISGNAIGDTAFYDPRTLGLVHYKGSRYFLANGMSEAHPALSQFAVGHKGRPDREGTFRDAEDGLLSGNAVAQGSVDSVLAVHLSLDAHASGTLYYWLAVGDDWDEVRRLDALVKHKGPQNLIRRTRDYWRLWVHKETPPLQLLPDKITNLYHRSLLVLRTQIDWGGGIVAGNDSDVIQFNRDTYSYVWPRDGALIANALDHAGYFVPAQDFYRFVAKVILDAGYVWHKYNPDGTPASSWHPWYANGTEQLPIQEDETALVLWALWHHFVLHRDIEFLKPLYRPLIKRCADFMTGYRDKRTGLPAPSYDLWEERRGILSYTVGAVFGGLTAASLFCTIFGEEDKADQYRQAAVEIRDAASEHLWRPEINRFCRMVSFSERGEQEVDSTCDASMWGLFAFGLYDVDDPRITATMDAIKDRLWIRNGIGGMARYEDDSYYRTTPEVPGNPWFVCTLWYADYLIAKAKSPEDLAEALDVVGWVVDRALPSGVLAEQVDTRTGGPLSVSPLTWSHGTFIRTVHRLLKRMAVEEVCPSCGRAPVEARAEDWIEKMYLQACNTIRGACRLK